MTPESKFSEFFEELGGIDNLRLMVNFRNVEYDKRINDRDTVTFTVGWKNQVTFNVVKSKSYYGPPLEEEYYYYLYLEKFCWRLEQSEIRSHLSSLIKYHTGNEIFF